MLLLIKGAYKPFFQLCGADDPRVQSVGIRWAELDVRPDGTIEIPPETLSALCPTMGILSYSTLGDVFVVAHGPRNATGAQNNTQEAGAP